MEKSSIFSFSTSSLGLQFKLFFHLIHWLPSDQAEDLTGIGIHLPSCRQNLPLEETLFHPQEKETREPPNVRIKLISKRPNDLLWTPVITAIHMSDSSLAPTCKGMQVSNLSHLPHFCRNCHLPLPKPLEKRLHRGTSLPDTGKCSVHNAAVSAELAGRVLFKDLG